MQPSDSDLPAVGSGPALLRAAIRAAGKSEEDAARKDFKVAPSSLSEWLNGTSRPKGVLREVAERVYGVPLSAWDDERDRDLRLAVLNPDGAPPTSRRKRPAKTAATRARRTGTD